MKRKLKVTTEKWPIKGSFRISRGSITEITVVKVSITENEFKVMVSAAPTQGIMKHLKAF